MNKTTKREIFKKHSTPTNGFLMMGFDEFLKAIDEALQLEKKPSGKIDFDKMLAYLKECTGREFRVINKSVRGKMNARLREGYTKQDFVNAIKNACNAEYHKENGFQHLTPEFFSRASTLDKYGSVINNATKKANTAKPQESFKNNIPVE